MTRRRDRNWQALILLAAIAVPRGVEASVEDSARLLVYIEAPRAVEATTTVTLEGLVLEGDESKVRLVPVRTRLISSDLAGHQQLLVNAEVPPGAWSALRLEIARIDGQVGVASVSPPPPPEGVPIALDIDIGAERTEVVFLEWRPAAVDDKAPWHAPDIRSRPVGLPPVESLALLTSGSAGSVIVVDRLSGRVVGARRVGDDPRDIVYSRVEQKFFVALAGEDAIGVIEAHSLGLINTLPLQFGDEPSRLHISADRTTLFVLNAGSRSVTAMSLASLQQLFRIPVGEGPRSIAQDPLTGFVYVACEDEGVVQVIDPRRGGVARTLTPAPAPREVIIDPLTRALFLGSSVQRRAYQVNLDEAQDLAGGEISVCAAILGMAHNRRTLKLYAGMPRCKSIAVVRPDTGIEFAPISLPAAPGLMAFDQEFRQLFVVLPRAGALAICNPNRGEVDTLVEVGERPFAVCVP